jgi:general stress protein 26
MNQEFDHVWNLIKDERIAMLTTRDAAGDLRARPMATVNKSFGSRIWFMTREGSPKMAEILHEPLVCLSYANPDKNVFVSISGRAKIVKDPAKVQELWSEPARVWFPGGPQDPDIRLLEVEVESAEYWEGPSKATYAMNYVKALTTGHSPDEKSVGVNKKLSP